MAGALALAACSDGGDADVSSSPPATWESTSALPPSVCGYLFEWLSTFRFPLQPDPHAAYSYVVPAIGDDPVGFEITGPFPYAAWTEWTVYDDDAQPFALVEDAEIAPDDGSRNPFVVGTPVLSSDRSFRLLVIPEGTAASSLPESLHDVPLSNILDSPTDGDFFILANRVYGAFPGYNPGGAGGPTDTPFPQVRAIDLATGDDVDCGDLNELPDPSPPTAMPAQRQPSTGATSLEGGARIGPGLDISEGGQHTGAEYAPALDPDLIEFTRPPLLPGADVSSIPPSDDCAGYLGAITSSTEIGLIRMPHVATWFDTTHLDEDSPFVQEETTYVSFTQYGSAVGELQPGEPDTASLANEDLLVDGTGGATIVVWPRGLTATEQQQVFDHAEANGWAVMRGDEQGAEITSNLLVRLKGSSPSYQGGYEPTPERTGVPCYFDDNPSATSWAEVTGDEYVASAANIGPGAPQGVNCTVAELVDDSCLAELKTYISSTGGSYEATSG
ncbi:MAG: hypothetical protein ABW219_00410 [Ilumatobacteraceae bacterium]